MTVPTRPINVDPTIAKTHSRGSIGYLVLMKQYIDADTIERKTTTTALRSSKSLFIFMSSPY